LRAAVEANEGGRQHLLPVEPSGDLGEKLWELRFDGDSEPVLYVSDDVEVGMLARIRGNPLLQALILPQAVELVLRQLADSPGDEDDDGWKGRWTAYLSARGIEVPDDRTEADVCAQWARDASHAFAREHRFLTMARAHLVEDGHGD
jgi:hypothetical protein